MAVDAVNGKAKLASSVKNCPIPGPLATPLLEIANTFEEFLLGNLPCHPAVQDFLASPKNGFDSKNYVVFVFCYFFQQFDDIHLAFCQRMIIAKPDEICRESLTQHFLPLANGVESVKLLTEFLDVFPARGRIHFPYIRLNPPDSLSL